MFELYPDKSKLGYLFKLDNMCGGGLYPEMIFSLYDKLVVPVLCYGSEIWGYERRNNVERAHTKFCKRVLGVTYSASNVAVLGESGRYPLWLVYFTHIVKFWLKILGMSDGRLPKQCYLMNKQLCYVGRVTWYMVHQSKMITLMCG